MNKLTRIIKEILDDLQPTIHDEMRATDDPDDDQPGIQVTVGADERKPGQPWDYGWQTGDNSFSGGAYPYSHWGVGYLYPDSDTKELAKEMADEILEGIAQQ